MINSCGGLNRFKPGGKTSPINPVLTLLINQTKFISVVSNENKTKHLISVITSYNGYNGTVTKSYLYPKSRL